MNMLVVNRYDEPDKAEAMYGKDFPTVQWDLQDEHPAVSPGDVVERCGFVSTWSEKHKVGTELKHLRHIGDDLVDSVLINPPTAVKRGRNGQHDYASWLLEQHKSQTLDPTLSAEQQSAVKQLISDCCVEPEWLDMQRLRQGQIFFLRYPLASMLSLLNHSLIAGVSAPKINRVLTATNYLSSPSSATVYKRLVDTTQFVVDLLLEHAMEVGGVGWRSCVNVRFLHGQVRRRLLQRKGEKQWVVDEENGLPINMEDNQTTLLAFSLNLVLGHERMGIQHSRQEKEDYIHLWRWCGALLGMSDPYNPCTSLNDAFTAMGGLVMHSIDPKADASTKLLANSILGAVEEHYKLIRWFDGWQGLATPKYVHTLVARQMLGEHFSDLMQIPKVDGTITIAHDGLAAWLTYQRVKRTVSAMSLAYNAWGWLSYTPYLQEWVIRANTKFLVDWLASQDVKLPKTHHAILAEDVAGSAARTCPYHSNN